MTELHDLSKEDQAQLMMEITAARLAAHDRLPTFENHRVHFCFGHPANEKTPSRAQPRGAEDVQSEEGQCRHAGEYVCTVRAHNKGRRTLPYLSPAIWSGRFFPDVEELTPVGRLHIHVIARFEGDKGWPGPVRRLCSAVLRLVPVCGL